MFARFEKYKALILYGIFGVTTTIINVVSYALFLFVGINVQIAVVVSWLLAVIVAYLTNRVWVFNSGAVTKVELLREFSDAGCGDGDNLVWGSTPKSGSYCLEDY